MCHQLHNKKELQTQSNKAAMSKIILTGQKEMIDLIISKNQGHNKQNTIIYNSVRIYFNHIISSLLFKSLERVPIIIRQSHIWQLYCLQINHILFIMKATFLAALALTACLASAYDLSMFYCGFGGNFCGQSTTDDVHSKTTTVILAFVNTQTDGSVLADDANFPVDLISSWHASGKKVLISVGGQNGNWPNVFASDASTNNFIASLLGIVEKYGLDGVDLDIQNYLATPHTVANMILNLRAALGNSRLIVVSPEDVTVMQEFGVPDADTVSGYYNYFVPIIRLADGAIDYYQPQAYNNWYEMTYGTVDYLKNVYLNWRNLQGMVSWAKPIANFTGVDGNKLLIGIEASPDAGGSNYYNTPEVIAAFKQWLADNNYPLRGFMMWDSHWDTLNNNVISNACTS